MRILIGIITLPLFFDPTPGTALRKLGEQKSYAFTVALKIDDEIGGNLRQLAVPVTAVVVKPDVLHAKLGDRGQVARHGAAALYEESGAWKTQEELEKERRQANAGQQGFARPDPLDPLMTLVTPYEVIARRGGLAKQKTTEKVNGAECVVYVGALAKDAATDIAKLLTRHIPAGGGAGNMPGGGGPNVPGGGGSSLTPKDVRGDARLLIDATAETPVQLVETVKFKADVPQQGGQTSEQEITVTRTWTLSQLGTAKLELSADIKKRLAIKD